ncbi:hypothetical protein Ade02nite_84380 [Paractinoplanes deccanensis]|uniref:Uncharacterized protein n=1 Tax=Paractinoplanes deccanensis TaxID=113561 RepID=A0ABQ3YIH3_9ACTN|nr:hypothetical protein Ade02nite_84380 [Actinoplanes deccanensis]
MKALVVLDTLVWVGVLVVGLGWVARRRGHLGRVAWMAACGIGLLAVGAVGDVAWLLFAWRMAEEGAGIPAFLRWNSTVGTATGVAAVCGIAALAGSLFLRPPGIEDGA